jgi:phosphohistidine phosphatase
MTLDGLCDGWPAMAALDHIVDEDLYTFASDDLVDWLESRPSELEAVFIIGHNPALTELTNRLTKSYTVDNLPTAGYVQLSLEIDQWDQLLHCVASLEHSLLPKQLK